MPKQQNDTAARPRWNRLWRQRPTPRSSISPNKMNRAAPYLFLAPSLAGLCVFVLVPFADAVRRSFTDAMGSRFVGFANYASVLGNSAFRLAAGNTARFIGVCVPLLLCVSLLLAVAVRAAKDGGRIFKTTYLIPMAIPVASIVLLWKVLFAQNGLANTLLAALGAQPVDFMGTGAAFWVLIATYLWKNSGYDMVLWAAGLDRIPKSQYEAAAVDGANAWQTFWAITWPGLGPTLGLAALLSLINSFKVFREAYLVAGSYPHESMYLLQHLFNNWFLSLELGRITAAAVIVVGVMLAKPLAALVITVGSALMTSQTTSGVGEGSFWDLLVGIAAIYMACYSPKMIMPVVQFLGDDRSMGMQQAASQAGRNALVTAAQLTRQVVTAAAGVATGGAAAAGVQLPGMAQGGLAALTGQWGQVGEQAGKMLAGSKADGKDKDDGGGARDSGAHAADPSKDDGYEPPVSAPPGPDGSAIPAPDGASSAGTAPGGEGGGGGRGVAGRDGSDGADGIGGEGGLVGAGGEGRTGSSGTPGSPGDPGPAGMPGPDATPAPPVSPQSPSGPVLA